MMCSEPFSAHHEIKNQCINSSTLCIKGRRVFETVSIISLWTVKQSLILKLFRFLKRTGAIADGAQSGVIHNRTLSPFLAQCAAAFLHSYAFTCWVTFNRVLP